MVLDAHEFREECIACYEKAVELEPHEPRWAWLLATRIQRSDPARAIQLLNVKHFGNLGLPFLVLRVTILQEMGEVEQVDDALNSAVAKAAENPYVKIQIARRLYEKQELEAARSMLTRSESDVSFDRYYEDAAKLRARIDQADGRPEDAARFMKLAASLPLSITTVANPILAELASKRRDPLWLGERAVAAARRGGMLALSELEGLVQRLPEVVPNRIHLAMVLLETGQHQQAETVLLQGLELNPDNDRLLMTLAAVHLDLENWPVAEATLRRLLVMNPDNGAAWSDLGFVLEQQAQLSEAIQAFEKASQILPEDDELLRRLSALRRSINESQE